jgi:hypothetical protein
MFGYININKEELKIKDYNKYRSFYCGVCKSLGRNYGIWGQATLSYDMTFVAIVLSSLYEDDTKPKKARCALHFALPHKELVNPYTDYAAAMNVLLTYYKLKDDWEDDRSVKSNAFACLLKRAFKKAAKKYPRQAKVIQQCIKEQTELEAKNVCDLDDISAPTGKMLQEIFDMKEDEWKKFLRKLGLCLGKYIYILDAYVDLPKDIKKNSFNPLIAVKDEPDFEDSCENMLVMLAAEAARAFEALPILENEDIIRNILYAGIWSKFKKGDIEK